MRRTKWNACGRSRTGTGLIMALTLGGVLLVSGPAFTQDRPPVQEPIALEGTMKAFYRAANIVVVTTMDGVEHVYHFTKNLIVHGGKTPGVDALDELEEGTPIVIHRRVNDEEASAEEIDLIGGNGLKITEGRVSHIDRRKNEITIRYGNGKTETLRLTTTAAAESTANVNESNGETPEIVIYYADEEGRKVAHYVTKKR
jgi:hypothetical protein